MIDALYTPSGVVNFILLSCFLKIVVALVILRFGLGLNGLGIDIAVLATSLALTFFVFEPHVNKMGGWDQFAKGSGGSSIQMQEFMHKQIDPVVVEALEKFNTTSSALHQATQNSQEPVQDSGLTSETEAVNVNIANESNFTTVCFIISELREAFTIGVFFLLPFVLIDLLVVNILMSMSVTQIQYAAISVPLKLGLFVLVDGWTLVTERLLGSYLMG